jgi:putative ABC transport system substrate-binding protein
VKCCNAQSPGRQQVPRWHAALERLPAIYETSDFLEAGGLLSYGPDIREMWRRTATYVDKILKGASPANIPVEQPSKFAFVMNMKAAEAIGFILPRSILVQLTRVIE